ncbi:uncharacterized protein LOC119689534 [Teleopsis dalmanni]|uniref:uncharacterized protein LOC119689534 n=1 Tax=Teleopsis dalmanni TaxID=139649 RepID=UPI0018CDD5F6|nr:uncharacterized protein LOC119689534 [Teleopsis dalmanni]
MKFLIVVFLALVALTTAAEFSEPLAAKERSISSQIVDAIEGAKTQMPCGFPGLGVPPMAPLKIGHKDININAGSFELEGAIDNFKLYGLNEFDIVEMKVSTITSKITFKFHFDIIHCKTVYNMLMRTGSNMKKVMNRGGNAKLALKDLTIWGTIKYSLGLIGSNGLRLKEFKVYASLGKVVSEIEGLSNIKIINRKLNEIIEEWIMLAINDNTDNMADISNDFVVPIANEIIGERTLTDLIGLIGGGGNGEEGEEKEECIPPIDED